MGGSQGRRATAGANGRSYAQDKAGLAGRSMLRAPGRADDGAELTASALLGRADHVTQHGLQAISPDSPRTPSLLSSTGYLHSPYELARPSVVMVVMVVVLMMVIAAVVAIWIDVASGESERR